LHQNRLNDPYTGAEEEDDDDDDEEEEENEVVCIAYKVLCGRRPHRSLLTFWSCM
jgi:hypothetical protein